MEKLDFWYKRSKRFYDICTYYQSNYDPFMFDRFFRIGWDTRAMYIASKYIDCLNSLNEKT